MNCAPDFQGVAMKNFGNSTVTAELDHNTGIPFPAIIPNESISPGVLASLGKRGSIFPLKFNRFQLQQLWYEAKRLKISAPTGNAYCSIDRIFSSVSIPDGGGSRAANNHFPPRQESFAYPLDWEVEFVDEGATGENIRIRMIIGRLISLSQGLEFPLSDGNGGYYFEVFFSDSKDNGDKILGVTNVNLNPDAITVGELDFLGAKCDILTDNATLPYGNVKITIDKRWRDS